MKYFMRRAFNEFLNSKFSKNDSKILKAILSEDIKKKIVTGYLTKEAITTQKIKLLFEMQKAGYFQSLVEFDAIAKTIFVFKNVEVLIAQEVFDKKQEEQLSFDFKKDRLNDYLDSVCKEQKAYYEYIESTKKEVEDCLSCFEGEVSDFKVLGAIEELYPEETLHTELWVSNRAARIDFSNVTIKSKQLDNYFVPSCRVAKILSSLAALVTGGEGINYSSDFDPNLAIICCEVNNDEAKVAEVFVLRAKGIKKD